MPLTEPTALDETVPPLPLTKSPITPHGVRHIWGQGEDDVMNMPKNPKQQAREVQGDF